MYYNRYDYDIYQMLQVLWYITAVLSNVTGSMIYYGCFENDNIMHGRKFHGSDMTNEKCISMCSEEVCGCNLIDKLLLSDLHVSHYCLSYFLSNHVVTIYLYSTIIPHMSLFSSFNLVLTFSTTGLGFRWYPVVYSVFLQFA